MHLYILTTIHPYLALPRSDCHHACTHARMLLALSVHHHLPPEPPPPILDPFSPPLISLAL